MSMGIMVRGLVGDDLMLAGINFIVLPHFNQEMDARRLFCFAKNRKPMMTGSMAVVGRRSSSRLKPYAFSLAGRPSPSRLTPFIKENAVIWM
jgi:hypothetical protein